MKLTVVIATSEALPSRSAPITPEDDADDQPDDRARRWPATASPAARA